MSNETETRRGWFNGGKSYRIPLVGNGISVTDARRVVGIGDPSFRREVEPRLDPPLTIINSRITFDELIRLHRRVDELRQDPVVSQILGKRKTLVEFNLPYEIILHQPK